MKPLFNLAVLCTIVAVHASPADVLVDDVLTEVNLKVKIE